MAWIHLEQYMPLILGKKSEAFPGERAIRFLQFKFWLLFPNEDEVVERAGQLLATEFLRGYEYDNVRHGKRLGDKELSSKTLARLLTKTSYTRMYDAFFDRGWTILGRSRGPVELLEAVVTRRRDMETVCEMIDYQFRALEHATDEQNRRGIVSRSEFYRWYKHPNGRLSWRTIRKRWQSMRDSAPFLYASKVHGLQCLPSGIVSETKPMSDRDTATLRRFLGITLYVATKIDSPIHWDLSELGVAPIRPKTTPLTEKEVSKMLEYKSKVEEMRAS